MRIKLREQRHRRVMRGIRVVTLILLLILAIVARFYVPKVVAGFPVFRIQKIMVEPSGYETFIRQLLSLPLDESLLSLDMKKVYSSICDIYFIEDCIIRKDLPSTLRIVLTIRKPWVTLRSGTRTMLMDRKGSFLPFEGVSTSWTVEGIPIGDVGKDKADSEAVAVLSEIEKWYNYYRIATLFPVRLLSLADSDSIELRGEEGVVYLYPEELNHKFSQLKAVLTACQEESLSWEYIDMRFSQPYVKKKGSNGRTTIGDH
ncbi:MAG: hypothetical protein WDA18_03085 [Candidatus Ratteibacteria bacterium]